MSNEPKYFCKMCQKECDIQMSSGTFEKGDRIAQVSKCCHALVYTEGSTEYNADK